MLTRADTIPRFAEPADIDDPDYFGVEASVTLYDVEVRGLVAVDEVRVWVRGTGDTAYKITDYECGLGKWRKLDANHPFDREIISAAKAALTDDAVIEALAAEAE
jgi:hypothetical protein